MTGNKCGTAKRLKPFYSSAERSCFHLWRGVTLHTLWTFFPSNFSYSLNLTAIVKKGNGKERKKKKTRTSQKQLRFFSQSPNRNSPTAKIPAHHKRNNRDNRKGRVEKVSSGAGQGRGGRRGRGRSHLHLHYDGEINVWRHCALAGKRPPNIPPRFPSSRTCQLIGNYGHVSFGLLYIKRRSFHGIMW